MKYKVTITKPYNEHYELHYEIDADSSEAAAMISLKKFDLTETHTLSMKVIITLISDNETQVFFGFVNEPKYRVELSGVS